MRQKQHSKKHPPTTFPVKNTFPVNTPVPSVPSVPSIASSLGSSIVQGFGFGTGSAVARQAVDSIFRTTSSTAPNPTDTPPSQDDPSQPCAMALQNLNACATTSSDCHHFIHEFTKCVEATKK